MEVLELIKQRHRMCDYYGDNSCVRDDSRETCPALNIDCSLGIPTSEQLVEIVEQWAKEHPEKLEQEQQKLDQGTIGYLDPTAFKEYYASFQSVKSLKVFCEQLADRVAALEKYPVEPMNEPKRTNKDVLLAAFPRMVMDGDVPELCPRIMGRDIHIQHCAGRSCDQCRHEYWLAEMKE